MAGQLQNLQNWLVLIKNLDLKVIIIHDFRDQQTLNELREVTANLMPGQCDLQSGVFGSPGAARNAGLDIAESKYICFWDSDDLPQPENICDFLRKQQGDFDVLVGQFLTVGYSMNEKKTELSQDKSVLDIALKPGLWRMIFLREFVESHRFKSMKMGEDQLFLAELIKLNPRLVFTYEHFYTYVVGRIGQLTSNSESKLDLIKTYQALLKLRVGTSGYQFEYLSATIIRLWFSLLRMLKFRTGITRLLRSLITPDLILNRHPLLHLRIFFFVTSKLFKKQ
jgi:glycosyltransferase involved in cell wall biosynthesis